MIFSFKNRLLFILAFATLIRLPFVFFTPRWQAPDEYPHFHYLRTLAETGKFPVSHPTFPDYEAYQPPLYYLIGAGIFKLLANSNVPAVPVEVSRIELDLPLVVIALRLFSVALGVGTVYLAHRIGSQIFSCNEILALALPLMLALHPTFVSNTTSITNDALANFIGAFLVWILIRHIYHANTTAPRRTLEGSLCEQKELRAQSRRDAKITHGFPFAILYGVAPLGNFFFYKDITLTGLLGLSLGVGFLTKHNLLPFAALASFVLWLEKKSFTAWLQQASMIIAISLLVSGWHYWHNFQQYGSWLAINPGVDIEFSALIWDWSRWVQVIRNYNWSFWCAFGRTYEIHLPAWFYLIFFLPLTLLIFYAAGRAVRAHFPANFEQSISINFPRRETTLFFLFGFFIYVVAALGYTASYPLNCAWGKYVFPFLIPIWALMLSALHAAVGQKFLKFLVVFLAMSFIFMNATILAQISRLHNVYSF